MPQEIGVLKEVFPGEKRVATVPDVVEKLIKQGFRVAIRAGAGSSAQISDDAYRAAGAAIVTDRAALWQSADIVFKVRAPSPEELGLMRDGTVVVSFIWPAQNPQLMQALAAKKATVLANGQRAAHLARAEARCAVVDGQHRRLSRGDRGGARVRSLLHRFDHRRGESAAGEGVRDRRRRGGSRRDRRGVRPGRDRARQRHAPGSGRPDQVAGR